MDYRFGSLVYCPPKMLTSDSPAGHFQLNPVAIFKVYFSANEIDAAISNNSS
jgi:hypothetical protein